MDRIYLDNNATTIVDPRVKEAMEPFFCQQYGNPNSLHSFGTEVHPAMRLAMDRLYCGIGAGDEDDIIVTSCACEGNNHVLKGVYFDLIRNGPKNEILTTQVEHPCVRNTCAFLESLGAKVTYMPVNADGIVDGETLRRHIHPDRTALVSVMWANNETGLIFPRRASWRRSAARTACCSTPTPCRPSARSRWTSAGCRSISSPSAPTSSTAPRASAACSSARGCKLTPLIHGGEQMGGKRAGTVNVPYLVGMGLAMEMAVDNLAYEDSAVRRLRDRLEDAILAIPDTLVVGKRELRTPNTILASFRGIEGEAMIWDLNANGVAASTGSACASESLEPNPTFVAMCISDELAHTGIRFSLSRFTHRRGDRPGRGGDPPLGANGCAPYRRRTKTANKRKAT